MEERDPEKLKGLRDKVGRLWWRWGEMEEAIFVLRLKIKWS